MRLQDDCISVVIWGAEHPFGSEDLLTIEPLNEAHVTSSTERSKGARSTGRLTLTPHYADEF